AFEQAVAATELAAEIQQAAFFHRAIRKVHAEIKERAVVEINPHAVRLHELDVANGVPGAHGENHEHRQRAAELAAAKILAHLFGLKKRVVEHRVERALEVLERGAEVDARRIRHGADRLDAAE